MTGMPGRPRLLEQDEDEDKSESQVDEPEATTALEPEENESV